MQIILCLQVIIPGNNNFTESYGDIEFEIYLMLVALRCAPFLPSYIEVSSSDTRIRFLNVEAPRYKVVLLLVKDPFGQPDCRLQP